MIQTTISHSKIDTECSKSRAKSVPRSYKYCDSCNSKFLANNSARLCPHCATTSARIKLVRCGYDNTKRMDDHAYNMSKHDKWTGGKLQRLATEKFAEAVNRILWGIDTFIHSPRSRNRELEWVPSLPFVKPTDYRKDDIVWECDDSLKEVTCST